MKWEDSNESPRLPLVKHGPHTCSVGKWATDSTGRGGQTYTIYECARGEFCRCIFFNFKNVTTLFPITVPIFPHTRLSKHWDQGTFISESVSFGGWMAVIKPGNHYIPLARKLKLMPLHYPSLLFYSFVSLKWLLKFIIKMYWGLSAIINTKKK